MILIIIGMVFMVVLIFSIFTIFSTRNSTTQTVATCSQTSAQFSTSSLASQECTQRGSSWKYFHNVNTNTFLMKIQMLFVWKRKKALTEIQVFYLFFGFSNTNIILIKERNTLHMEVRKSHNKEKSFWYLASRQCTSPTYFRNIFFK